MATAALSGKTGSITIGGAVSEVVDWNITLSSAALDATSMGSSGWKEFIDGLKEWKGSFKTLVYANLIGSQATASFVTASAGGKTLSGKILVTEAPGTVEVAGVVTWQFTFVGSGAMGVA